MVPTADERAVQLTYLVCPAHRADTGNIRRQKEALQDCADRLAAAGHPVTRVSIQTGYRFREALIVFPAPAPEPEPVDPAVCRCGGRWCPRAQERELAVTDLNRSVAQATSALLAALEQSAKEPVLHAIGDPWSSAIVLDNARSALLEPPPVDTAAVLADPECEDCTAQDCIRSGTRARIALDQAALFTSVHTVSYRAVRITLDRAHLQLTPGDRWRQTAVEAAERIGATLATARAALHLPTVPDRRRWRGERVSLLNLRYHRPPRPR
ncbi:hypothetical protein LN042_23050 [Kitasatospora sp. RB6PN24]|uniref:hypothetical protein n=1 Tax=Kitasatospora humi TaxID=2893891 RepID=UPI001E472889|nr:hypothetical protein [Kitasatospora humi]MCC9309914.1 hypothetical protein [Kitasatospora humi]